MSSLSAFLGYTLLQSLVQCAVLVALCDISKRLFRLDDLLAFCAAVLLLGLLGYLAFWAAYANYPLFAKGKLAVLAALAIWFGVIVWRRGLGHYRWLAEPLLFTFLYFIVVLMLGFSGGGLDDPRATAAERFSHPLPPDNILPLIVSMALQIGHIPSPLAGDWVASDRPPLQTGLYMLLTLKNHELAYQIVSTWLQTTFLFGVWGLAVAAGLATAARRLVLLACCLLPTALINTFFVWPKMIAAGYLLLVFALVFCQPPRDERERIALGVLIGGLAALSILCHGVSFFALIGFAVTVVLFWAWPPLKSVVWATVTLIAMYLPWMLFQRFIDPPGNRLLKWHLAGVIEVDGRGFFEALRDSYGALSWHDYLIGKVDNLALFVTRWPAQLADLARLVFSPGDAGLAEKLRYADFFFLLPSLHVFSIALIAALLLLFTRPHEQRCIALRLIVATLATCAALVILIFTPGETTNHVGPYATQVMATVFAFMVLSRWPPLAVAFILIQLVTVATLYGFTVRHDAAHWPTLALCIGAATILIAYSLYPLRSVSR